MVKAKATYNKETQNRELHFSDGKKSFYTIVEEKEETIASLTWFLLNNLQGNIDGKR